MSHVSDGKRSFRFESSRYGGLTIVDSEAMMHRIGSRKERSRNDASCSDVVHQWCVQQVRYCTVRRVNKQEQQPFSSSEQRSIWLVAASISISTSNRIFDFAWWCVVACSTKRENEEKGSLSLSVVLAISHIRSKHWRSYCRKNQEHTQTTSYFESWVILTSIHVSKRM